MNARAVKRQYDASRRQVQAQQLRLQVAWTARDLFAANGFAATRIADIAQAAGVSQQLVYAAFGSKRGLLEKVLDWTIGGDDADIPLAERPTIKAVGQEPSVAGKIALFARHVRVVQERAGPTLAMLRAAADADVDARSIFDKVEAQRRAGMGMFVAELRGAGPLRDGLTDEQAADAIWGLVPDVLWSMLVGRRGWTPMEFEQWLAGVLGAAVLEDRELRAVRRRVRALPAV
jgi:AcrR family transcriptional regulator